MSEQIEAGEQLYELNLRISSNKGFGVGLEAILAGEPLPPAGVRFDIALTGKSTGKVAGAAETMGYFFIRGDGSFQLHVHGAIETDDGTRIAISSVGTSEPSETLGLVELSEDVELHTGFPEFAWVNDVSVSARGIMNMGTGRLVTRGYAT